MLSDHYIVYNLSEMIYQHNIIANSSLAYVGNSQNSVVQFTAGWINENVVPIFKKFKDFISYRLTKDYRGNGV